MFLVERIDLPRADRQRVQTQNALLGFAFGDAYGYAVERSLDPMTGVASARVTDATQLMLTSCEGLIRGQLRLKAGKQPVLASMLDAALTRWGAVQPGVTVMGARTSSGVALAWLHREKLLRRNRRHGKATVAALVGAGPGQPSKGNGALSRVMVLGLLDNFDPADAREVAALTHAHDTAMYAAQAAVAIGQHMRTGGQHLKAAAASVAAELSAIGQPQAHVVASRIGEALNAQVTGRQFAAPPYLADGALAIAIHAAAGTREITDALATATVGRGRDAPVIGALTGFYTALEVSGQSPGYGVITIGEPTRDGLQMFPGAWLERLEGRALVERVAADGYRNFIPGYVPTADDAMRYPHV